MYTTISDELIISVIGSYEQQMTELNGKIENAFTGMASDAELMEAASMPGLDNESIKNRRYTISDIYERYQIMRERQKIEVSAYIRALIEKRETINRILSCYNVLPPEEQSVLDNLYVKYDYQTGIIKLMKELQVSRRTVIRKRKSAITHIRQLYDSELTNTEIYRQLGNKNIKYR